jgi:hypothetical protein
LVARKHSGGTCLQMQCSQAFVPFH